MNYKTYAEAKIANPDCDIFSNGEEFGAIKNAPTNHFANAWVICNPAYHCSSIKEFLEAGFKFDIGDLFLGADGAVHDVGEIYPQTNKCEDSDDKRFIISASALNGGCKIPVKGKQWSIYNNTIPLCDLTDEQYGKMRRARDNGGLVEFANVTNDFKFEEIGNPNWCKDQVYRIKPKSERELFIEAAIGHGIKPETQSPKQIFGELFDSGKFKYIDNTQHFGENI